MDGICLPNKRTLHSSLVEAESPQSKSLEQGAVATFLLARMPEKRLWWTGDRNNFAYF